MTTAAHDRLLHRCTVVNIRGESYRMKEKLKAEKPSKWDIGRNSINGLKLKTASLNIQMKPIVNMQLR